MSNRRDFVIINGYLDKYTGNKTDIIIPNHISEIGHSVFRDSHNLLSVVIPDNVKRIGAAAFQNCKNLRFVKTSTGITDVGYNAFENCKSLTQIDFVTFALGADNHAFRGCDNLTDIVFPENDSDFIGIFRAYEQRIFHSKQSIIILAALLEKKFDFVKNDASLIRKIKANKSKLISFATKAEKAEIVENLFSLYAQKIKLDELDDYISACTESISVTAFLLEYKVRQYSADEQQKHEADKFEKELGFKERTLSEWKKIYTVETNGNTATIKSYKGNETDIIVPEKIGKYTVTAIAEAAFSPFAKRINSDIINSRKNIISITIPGSVTSIGHSAFKGCTKLTSVSIPYGVTRISNCTFSDCLSLAYVTIPDSVTSIGYSAFEGCSSLDSITIPNNVIYIGHDAFSDCPNLTLHAPAGSCAENCAKMNIIPFVAE